MLAEKVRDLSLDRLGQQSTRPIAQDFGELIVDVSWLNQLDNVIFGHGISLLRWRSGGVKHPHDMPPSRFLPSPTFSDSSLLTMQIGDWHQMMEENNAHLQNSLRMHFRGSLDGLQCRYARGVTITDQRGNHEINACRQSDPSALGRLARGMGIQRFRRLGFGSERVGWGHNRWCDLRWCDRKQPLWLLRWLW